MDGAFDKRQRKLSSQELACLNLLVTGKTNKEIAKALEISPATVASYLKAVYRKLGTQSRTHAVAVAIREGFISNDTGEESNSNVLRSTDKPGYFT